MSKPKERQQATPREYERRYSANREAVPGDYDTVEIRQNTEASGGDHWLVELNLVRWRTAKELADYLKWVAQMVEAVAKTKDER